MTGKGLREGGVEGSRIRVRRRKLSIRKLSIRISYSYLLVY